MDVCGPPGSGKSTLCDALWGPHDIAIEDRLPPASWHDWLNEISRLFHLIRKHPTLPAAIRMVNRSVRKIATVARMPGGPERCGTCGNGQKTTEQGWPHKGIDLIACSVHMLGDTQDWYPPSHVCEHWKPKPYIQTALAQRGLGFGWRMVDLGIDINELRHYFRLMPVSIGVAFTRCPPEIVAQRNRDREKVAATRNENREHMIPLMAPAIELAIEVLRERNVPVVEIDTTQPIDDARARLLAFANQKPFDPEASGSSCEAPILSPPPWWDGPAGRQPLPLAPMGTLWRAYESRLSN